MYQNLFKLFALRVLLDTLKNAAWVLVVETSQVVHGLPAHKVAMAPLCIEGSGDFVISAVTGWDFGTR